MISKGTSTLSRSLVRTIPQFRFSLVGKFRSFVTNGSIYRAIGILASIQIGLTGISTFFVDKQAVMAIEDYMTNNDLKENQHYQVAGIIKPGTIEIQRGTLNVKFTLTNFDDDLSVIYQGETKYEFKEGETLVITAYTPDLKQRNKIIGLDYLTKHSMDGNVWQDNVGANRQTYGLNARVQQQM